MAQLAVIMALVVRHHRGGRFIVLVILLVVIVALVVALVRSRRANRPVHDDWKPPVDPPAGPGA